MTKPDNLEYAFPLTRPSQPQRTLIAYRIINSPIDISSDASAYAWSFESSLIPLQNVDTAPNDGNGSVGQYVVYQTGPDIVDDWVAEIGFDPFDPNNHTPTSVRYWELQPGSDVMATSIDGLGPIAITDENAGGVIGDIAYVVSGYMYNAATAFGFEQPGWRGAFPDGSTNAVAVGDIFMSRLSPNAAFIVTEAGNVVIQSSGAIDYDSSTAASESWGPAGYWPYMERYDLKTKTWLPRVQLPEFSPSAQYTWSSEAVGYQAGSYVDYEGVIYHALTTTTSTDVPGAAPGIWEVAAPVPYATEGGFAGVINGKLYFGGGDGDGITGNEFFVYDPATQEFTRLDDTISFSEEVVQAPDYSPFGVVGGALWSFCVFGGPELCYLKYTPGGGWDRGHYTGDDTPGDQVQGVEIGGKLYFVYDRVYVFDPVALTVEAKAAPPSETGQPFLIGGKLCCSATSHYSQVYDPAVDLWTAWDIANTVPLYGNAENFSVVHDGVPYSLSGLLEIQSSGPALHVAGVYGLTGNQPTEIPTTVPGGPVSTPDPYNHNNPVEGDGQFTGLYPDNNYPLVDGQLDIEQQKRLQARQESNRTPRGVLATDLSDVYGTPNETYPAHPPFTEHGPAALTANDFESDDPAYGPADSTSV